MAPAHRAVDVSTRDGHDGNRTMSYASSPDARTPITNYMAIRYKRNISVPNDLPSTKSVKQMKAAHVKNKFNAHALDEAFPVKLPSLMQLIASSHVPAVNSNPRMTHRRISHGWW